jgi:hypothetical protein
MTELLKQAFAAAAASALLDEQQDEIARILLTLAGDEGSVIILAPEERADLAEAEAEVARGETISLEEAEAIWAKHGY